MKDTITIEVDANSEYTISTKYQTATMKSLDPASISEPRSPDFTGLDYVQVFDVPSDFLRTALTGTERKSDEIDFGIDGRKIKIFASNEGGKWDYNFECNEVETTKEYTRHAKMTYSGNHLKPLFTALNGAKAVDISLRFYTPDGKHGPLEVTANLPDGANIKYLLAPRINDGV